MGVTGSEMARAGGHDRHIVEARLPAQVLVFSNFINLSTALSGVVTTGRPVTSATRGAVDAMLN